MNHSLSDTNCTISSADLDPSDGNTVTVTSSESYVPITSDTYDTEDNRPMTSQPAHTQAPDSTGLIAAVPVVIIVLLGIIIVLVVALLVKKRYYYSYVIIKVNPLQISHSHIHDRSKNEENTQSKTTMKNVLYEPGKCKF